MPQFNDTWFVTWSKNKLCPTTSALKRPINHIFEKVFSTKSQEDENHQMIGLGSSKSHFLLLFLGQMVVGNYKNGSTEGYEKL